MLRAGRHACRKVCEERRFRRNDASNPVISPMSIKETIFPHRPTSLRATAMRERGRRCWKSASGRGFFRIFCRASVSQAMSAARRREHADGAMTLLRHSVGILPVTSRVADSSLVKEQTLSMNLPTCCATSARYYYRSVSLAKSKLTRRAKPSAKMLSSRCEWRRLVRNGELGECSSGVGGSRDWQQHVEKGSRAHGVSKPVLDSG